jgi:hypothetical protein
MLTALPSIEVNFSGHEGRHDLVTEETCWTDAIRIDGNTLQAPGVILASLATISPVLAEEKGLSPFLSFLYETISDLQGSGSSLHPLILLANALCVSDAGDTIWRSPNVLRLIRILQCLLKAEDGASHPQFGLDNHDYLFRKSDQVPESRFLSSMGIDQAVIEETVPRSEVTAVRTFIRTVRSNLDDVILDEGLHRFWEMVGAAKQLRRARIRISKTTDSQFAVAPSCAAVGDQVALLLGHQGSL